MPHATTSHKWRYLLAKLNSICLRPQEPNLILLVTRCQSSWLETKFDKLLLLKTGKILMYVQHPVVYGKKTSSTHYSLSRFTKLNGILCKFQPMLIMRSVTSALQIPTTITFSYWSTPTKLINSDTRTEQNIITNVITKNHLCNPYQKVSDHSMNRHS